MSNTRHAKWDRAQIDASNALQALGGLWDAAAAEGVRRAITAQLLRDMAADGAGPGAIAHAEQRLLELVGEEFWLQLGQDLGLIGAGS